MVLESLARKESLVLMRSDALSGEHSSGRSVPASRILIVSALKLPSVALNTLMNATEYLVILPHDLIAREVTMVTLVLSSLPFVLFHFST